MGVDRVVWKILLDFTVLICVAFPLLALILWGQPYERGYFEDDTSIRLPYKEQAISEGLMAGMGFAVVVVTIIIIEVFRARLGRGAGERFLSGRLVSSWAWESYNSVGVFTFGAAAQQLTSNLGKFVIGRLRPHFYDLCRPVYNSSSPLNANGYVQQFECSSGVGAEELKEMRLSFPSAHSSFAMYCAVFFTMYLQVKTKWRGSKLLRHGVQFAAVMSAWWVGLSRVQDHMHHWSDVAAGFLIGASYAVLVFVFVLKPKKYGIPDSWQEPQATAVLPRPVLAR